MTLLTVGTENMAQIFELVKDTYFPTLMKVYKNYTYLHDKLKVIPWAGRRYYVKYKIGGNYTASAAAERAVIPTPKGRKGVEGYTDDKYYYSPIDLTGPEFHKAESREVKIDLIQDAFTDCADNLLWTMNADAMGDGSGRKAQVNGTPAYDGGTGLTTVYFDNGSGFHFMPYETVQFGTNGTGYEIKSIDITGKSFTVGGNATSYAVDDAYIYHYGMYDAGLDTAVMGLKGHISASNPPSAAYQGLSRATTGYGFLQAYEKDQLDTAMTWLDFNSFIDEVYTRGREIPDLYMINTGVRNSIQLLMETKHQSLEPVVSNVGFAEVLSYTYAGKKIEFQVVLDVPPETMYALNTDYMHIIESRPIGWLTDENNPKMQRKPNYDIYEGAMARYWQIVCTNPQKFGKWINIKESSIS